MMFLKHIPYVFIFVFILLTGMVPAQAANEVSIEASISPSNASVGEPLHLSITVSGAGAGLKPPKLPEMENFSHYSQGHSEEVSFENGRMTSVSIFAFVLIPEIAGRLTVDNIDVLIGRIPYKAPALHVTIRDAKNSNTRSVPPAARTQSPATPAASRALPPEYRTHEEIFVQAWTDRDEVYINQPIYLTYTIYTRVPTTFKGGFEQEPSTTGFWIEDFPPQGAVTQHEKVINGRRYIVADVRSMALFPTQAGTMMFDPGVLKAEVEITRGDPFNAAFSNDIFGRRRFRQPTPMTTEVQSRVLRTDPIRLKVKPFPGDQPKSFAGAVGQYRLEAMLDTAQTEVGQPVTFKLRLTGEGNLNTVELPKLSPVEYFKYYDSSNSLNLRKDRFVVEGEKIQETVLVPRRPGEYEIPSLEFSYFDPRKNDYVTLRTHKLKLQVAGGAVEDEPLPEPQPAAVTAGQQQVELIDEDIHFIKPSPGPLRRLNPPLFLSPVFWYAIGMVLLSAVLAFLFKTILTRMRRDEGFIRLHRSHRLARRNMKTARRHLKTGAGKEFYQALSKSLYGYFADKMNVEPGAVGIQMLESRLKERCSEKDVGEVRDLLSEIDYGRFSTAEFSVQDMKKSFKDANRLIDTFERRRI